MTEKPWVGPESDAEKGRKGAQPEVFPEELDSGCGSLPRVHSNGKLDWVVVACEMIEDEVCLALRSLPPEQRPPVIWVESGLHDRPERLHAVLSDIISRLDQGAELGVAVTVPSVRPGRGPAEARREELRVGPVNRVVFAFGFCGNALAGISAQNLTLVLPRADDCITLLLNHGCKREEVPRNPRHYYLTRGWFCHESSLMEAFDEWVRRYGAEKAARLQKAMFAGYETVSLIDTKAYDVDEWQPQAEEVARTLGLGSDVVEGSVQLLEKLFQGREDSEIIVVPPGEKVTLEHLFRAKTPEPTAASN